eukprot:SAG31_NODE_985_length_10549_cov_2.605339_4_plen_136_part_00
MRCDFLSLRVVSLLVCNHTMIYESKKTKSRLKHMVCGARCIGLLAQITEDFLEEYGWLRLYRNIIELDKHEAAMLAENEELEANTIEIRKRLSEQQQAVERSVSKLKALTSAQRKDIADLGVRHYCSEGGRRATS